MNQRGTPGGRQSLIGSYLAARAGEVVRFGFHDGLLRRV